MRRAAATLLVLLAGCGGTSAPPVPQRVTVDAGGLTEEFATAVPAGGARVLTVAHVLDGARTVRVGSQSARVVHVDRRLDLAVLEIPGLDAPPVAYARAGGRAHVHLLRAGRSRTIAVRVRRRVTVELHDRRTGRTDVRPALELAATVAPGDSGAPVTDSRGRVVGIVFAAGSGTAWAVDVSQIPLLR